MLTRDAKANLVQALRERFGRQRISIFSDIRGISVAALTRFRRDLKTADAELKVAKKTLMRRALAEAGITLDPKELEGEIGVIFGYGDQAEPARLAARFGKEQPTFRVLRGILGGTVVAGEELIAFAALPPRDILLAMLARAFQAPLQRLVNVLQGNIRNLVGVLSQITAKRRI